MITEAYILAGGKSSRMGEDKGLKLLNGFPAIQYEIKVMSTCFPVVKINTGNQAYFRFGLEIVNDLIPDKGPIGGIYSALKDASGDIFVVGCDMPCITQEAVNFLKNNHKNSKVTVAAFQGKVHPLFGIYTREILWVLKERIKNNQLKMQDFLQEVQAEIIEMKDVITPLVFENVNTPQEFEIIEKLTKK